MTSRRSAVGRPVVVIAIMAVLVVAIAAGLALSPSSQSASTGIVDSTSTALTSFPGPSSPSYSGSSTASVDPALAGGCPVNATNTSGFVDMVTGTGSPAIICIQFYYYDAFNGYNASSPLKLNVSDTISIQAVQEVLSDGLYYPLSFDGSPNFTLSVSESQLSIGGPTNENEGAMVAYSVAANAGAAGKYQLRLFPASNVSVWLLNPQEPEQCDYYGEVVAGFGQPNYAQDLGSCITYPTSDLSGSTGTGPEGPDYYALAGVPYPLLVGNVYFRIIGVTNSTG